MPINNAKDKANLVARHAEFHEKVGLVIVGLSVLFLFIAGATGEIAWNDVLFNASIIMIALIFPMIEHNKIGNDWIIGYWILMFLFSAGTGVFLYLVAGYPGNEALFNPATLNFIFGGLVALAYHGMKTDVSLFGQFMWAVLLISLFCTVIYIIPWQHAPAGPVQDAGMWAETQLEPAAVVVGEALTTLGTCVQGLFPGGYGSFEQCSADIENLLDTIIVLLQGLPIWPLIEVVFGAASDHAAGFTCMLSHGFAVSPADFAYHDPTDPGVDDDDDTVPLEDCFDPDARQTTDDDTTTDTGTGDIDWEALDVSGDEATLDFDRSINSRSVSTVSDFSVSPSDISITGSSVSGSTITLSLSGDGATRGSDIGISEGDRVTITIRDTITADDGATISSGDCTARYEEGPTGCGGSPTGVE